MDAYRWNRLVAIRKEEAREEVKTREDRKLTESGKSAETVGPARATFAEQAHPRSASCQYGAEPIGRGRNRSAGVRQSLQPRARGVPRAQRQTAPTPGESGRGRERLRKRHPGTWSWLRICGPSSVTFLTGPRRSCQPTGLTPIIRKSAIPRAQPSGWRGDRVPRCPQRKGTAAHRLQTSTGTTHPRTTKS